MDLNRKIGKLKPPIYYVVIALMAVWYATMLTTAVERGMTKTLTGLFGLPILLMFPFLLRKMGIFPLFCSIVFLYWIPYNFALEYFGPMGISITPTEVGLYFFFALILTSYVIKPTYHSYQWANTWRNFPIFPFLLYICGAIIAYSIGKYLLNSAIGASIYRIRALCLFPAVICFLCIYLINTKEKAEKLLWIFLLSTLILGILFLFGRFVFSFISLSEYAKDSGRLSMTLSAPFLGDISINASGAGALFSIVFSLSFSFWLNTSSKKKRYLALGLVIVFVMVLLKSQGRAGLYASIFSAMAIWYLSTKFRRLSARLTFVKLLFIIICILGTTYYLAIVSETTSFRDRGLEFFYSPLKAQSFDSRRGIWGLVIPMIIRNPFGIGANGLLAMESTGIGELGNIYGDIWGVHNLILYLLLFSGFIGTIGFIWIFVWFIKRCMHRLNCDDPIVPFFCIAGIGIIIAFFINGLSSPVLYDSWETSILWFPVGIIIAAITLPDKVLKKRT